MSRNLTRRDLLRTSIAAGAACQLSAVDTSPAAGSKLGIISDEPTDNLDENAPLADLDRAKKLLAQQNVQISDIASPTFKWNLPQMPGRLAASTN